MITVFPLPKERNIVFSKQVTQDSIGDLSKQLLDIAVDDQYLIKLNLLHGFAYTPFPIKLHIDSYGGNAYQCLGLMGIIENSKTPIHTIVTGCAMSAGFLIAITGHKRFAYNQATFMYHQIADAMVGKLKTLEEEVFEARRLQDIIEKHTLTHTKLKANELKDNYEKKKDWYFSAKEALKYGIIDEIFSA